MEFNSPFKLPPNRVWRTYLGGKLLDEIEGKEDAKDTHFPEDWIASTVNAVNPGREDIKKEGISFIYDEKGKKLFFDEILELYGEELLGKEYIKKNGKRINILVKLLDPSIRLHFQVHPTREFSKKYLNSNNGKAESYIVLKNRDNKSSYVYMGFKEIPDKEYFKKLILEQDIEKIKKFIHKVPLNKKDVYFIEGGVPHALGEDVLLIEVQEPTDFVVRFEFERGGYVLPEKARFMNLDIDTAMNMFVYNSLTLEELYDKWKCNPIKIYDNEKGKEYKLIDNRYTDKFRVNRIMLTNFFKEKSINTYQICIVSDGEGYIETDNGKIDLKFGDKFFVPFNAKPFLYKTNSYLEIIKCLPPEN